LYPWNSNDCTSEHVCPALQTQSLSDRLLLGEVEFAGQIEQVLPELSLYCPAIQAVQAPLVPEKPALHAHWLIVAPVFEEYELLGQFEHAAVPATEYFPTSHAVHVVCPSIENFPGSQFVHRVVPFDALNFPATHAEKGPPFGPVYPAFAIQSVGALLAASEIEFCGQSRHARPVAALYFPALQKQSVALDAPSAEVDPTGQEVHLASLEEPSIVENLPAIQLSHRALPCVALYFPATHHAHILLGTVVLGSNPMSQKHALTDVLPGSEIPKSRQLAQVDAPDDDEYVPDIQSIQFPEPDCDLYFPAAQAR
jgi:hypothetical protein